MHTKPARFIGGSTGVLATCTGWLANIWNHETIDTACWCPNKDLKSAVENVVGGTDLCASADDRKLIGSMWNEKCPDNTVTIA